MAENNGGSAGDNAGRSNADFQWSQFDPEAYFHHYYGDPHPDDDRVAAAAATALRDCEPKKKFLDVIDVGTGPNLIPFLAAHPRAKTLTAYEYSDTNIRWLQTELAGSSLRPQWLHFWKVVRETYGQDPALPADPLGAIAAQANVVQGSIFDLPQAQWDAATMFFCAESITQRMEEFDAACSSFARCVRPGGTLAAAFLVRSDGYDVAGRRFPAINLSPEAIEAVFSRLTSNLRVEKIGIVDQEVRSGYSGALFLNARV